MILGTVDLGKHPHVPNAKKSPSLRQHRTKRNGAVTAVGTAASEFTR
jgi:hypothetical protein